jgi:WD40 repeat protein
MPASFDPTKAKSRLSYNPAVALYALALDPISGRIYCGGDDAAIHVFDPAADKKQAVARWSKHENYIAALTWVQQPARKVLISGGFDRRLIWWDTGTGQPLRSIEGHEGWVRDLAVTRDGKHLVSVGDDMLLKLWDVERGRLERTFAGHERQTPQGHVTALYAVAVSPDGKHAASGDRIGAVRVWELETGKLAQRFEVPILYTYDERQRKRSLGGIRALAFATDGVHLAVGGMGQVNNVDGLGGLAHIAVWDWRRPRQRFTAGAQGHKGYVHALQFHPAGDWLLGAGGGADNGLLAFWKTDPLREKKDGADLPVTRLKTDGHTHRLVLHPSKSEFYTAGYRKLEVWGQEPNSL